MKLLRYLFIIGTLLSAQLVFAGTGDIKNVCVGQPVTVNWTISNSNNVVYSRDNSSCEPDTPPTSGGVGSSAMPAGNQTCSLTITALGTPNDSAVAQVVVDQTKTWNGFACVAPSPVSATWTATPMCAITVHNSSCNTTLGWTSSGANPVALTDCTGNSLGSFGTGAQSNEVTVPYNTKCFQIRNGVTPISSDANVSALCFSNLEWNVGLGTCECAVGSSWDVNNGVCMSSACPGGITKSWGAGCSGATAQTSASDNYTITSTAPGYTGTANYSCNGSAVWGGSPNVGWSCVAAVCTGLDPTNATMCTGDNAGLSSNTAKSIATTCTATKCEFECNAGYIKSGNSCVLCSAGSYCPGPGDGASHDCPPNTYCPAGTIDPITCPNGWTSPQGSTNSGQCSPPAGDACGTASGGAAVSSQPSSDPARCSSGAYSDDPDAGGFFYWSCGTAHCLVAQLCGSSSFWSSISCTPCAGTGCTGCSASAIPGREYNGCSCNGNVGTPPTCTVGSGPTISSFTNNGPIAVGGLATLSWSVFGATSCSINQGIGSVASGSGSAGTGALNVTTSYSLTCTNANGSASAQSTVTVGGGGGGTPDLSASSISPLSVVEGGNSFSASIMNSGTGSTGTGFQNFFQFSTDGGVTATDIPVQGNTPAFAAVAAGGSIGISLNYNLGVAGGNYWLRACADKSTRADSGSIPESDESNNCGAWTKITVTPYVAPVGNLVDVTADNVNNILPWASTTIPVHVYATDVNFPQTPTCTLKDNNGAVVGSHNFNVAFYSPASYNYPITAPGAPGNYTYTASCADMHGNIATANAILTVVPVASCSVNEYIVGNSCVPCGTHGTSLGGTVYSCNCDAGYTWDAANQCLSDSGITVHGPSEITITPSTPMDINYSVLTNTSINIECVLRDQNSNFVGGLQSFFSPAGSFVSHTLTRTSPVGVGSYPYSVKCREAANHNIANVSPVTIIVTNNLADLTVVNNVAPSTATINQSTVFTDTVENIGTGSANNFNSFAQVFDGTGINLLADLPPIMTTSAVAPGGSASLSWNYTFTSNGTYRMRLCADKADRNDVLGTVYEGAQYSLEENNNCGPSTVITVSNLAPTIDLIPNSVYTWPVSPTAGVASLLTVDIKNNGGANTNAPVVSYVQINNGMNGTGLLTVDSNGIWTSAMSILAGQSALATRSYTFPAAGTYSLKTCVNMVDSGTNGNITESSTANNCTGWTNIIVGGGASLPDLVAGDIPPSSHPTNTLFTLSSVITNSGGTNVNSLFPTYFEVTGPAQAGSYGGDTINSLAVGGTAGTQHQFNFSSAGSYLVRACADLPNSWGTGNITESNEGNNCSNWSILTIGAPAGIDLTAANVPVVPAVANAAFTLTSSISNIGSQPTGAPFFNFFQYSSLPNGAGIVTDIPGTSMAALASGATGVASKSVTLAAGTYYFRACADKSNSADTNGSINEGANEGNNCSANWTSMNVAPGGSACIEGNYDNGIQCVPCTPGNYCPGPVPQVPCPADTYCPNPGHTPPGPTPLPPLPCPGAPVGSLVCLGGPLPTGTLSADPLSCTIAIGDSTCPVSFHWTTTNPVTISRVNPDLNPIDGLGGPTSALSNNNTETLQVRYTGPVGQTFWLYNNALPIVGTNVQVVADCAPTVNWAPIAKKCTRPDVVFFEVTGQHYYSNPLVESLKFQCFDSTHYRIEKGGNPWKVKTPLAGGVNSVQVVTPDPGNDWYQIFCINETFEGHSDVKEYDSSAPANPQPIIDAYPKTINSDGKTTISWSITRPRVVAPLCKITASSVCANGTCSQSEQSALGEVTNTLTTGFIDGSNNITIAQAVSTIEAGQNGVNAKARGKKTLSLKYTTDFTIDCNGVKATTRIRVANSSEQ